MKIKNVLSVIIAICMMFSMMTVSFAKNADGYEVTAISFSYFEDNAYEEALSLEGGKELVAEVSVSKTGAEQNLIFALVVYSEDVMYDFETVTKPVSAEKVDFVAKASVPEDVSDCYAVAFLWDGIGTMNNITNSALFPMGSTNLESLYVDGVSVEGFDPATKAYTVKVASTKVEVPEIKATPIDAGVKVDVEHFVDVFPGKTVITVTNGKGEESIYTVNYTCSEKLVSNLTILEDNTIPDEYGGGDVVAMPAYHPCGFKVGQVAYSDRSQYFVQAVTDESLIGCDYITGGITWYNGTSSTVTAFKSADVLPWINFNIARSGTVNVFHYENRNQSKFDEYGFELSVCEDKNDGFFRTDLNADKKRPHIYKFSKHFNAGDKVSIPNSADNDNTYSVIIQYDGFEVPEVPNFTALSSVTVDGVLYEEFDAKVFDMKLPIAADAVNKPVVTAEAAFDGAEVSVKDPESFPGKTVITVSKRGEKDSVYTINWTIDGGLVSDLAISPDYAVLPNGNGTVTTPLPVWIDELKVGSMAFSDRTFAVEAVNGEHFLGKPYFAMPLNWANAAPWREGIFNGEIVDDWFSFKLNRDATVRVLASNSKNGEALTKNAYTFEYYSEATPITVNISTNDTHPKYDHVYSRTYKAGTTVNIPNLWGGQVFFVVFDFADYGEVLTPTPEPEPEPVTTTALSTITVDGAELEAFNKATLTYEAIVDPLADAAPAVEATAETEGADVTVADATTFPGKTTITVSVDGAEDTVYTINWKTEENLVSDITILQDNTIPAEFGGGAVSVMPGYLPGGFEVGALAYADRATRPVPTYRVKGTAEESFLGCDYITGCIGWYNGTTPTVKAFKSSTTLPWINFTVGRGATVNVLMYRNTHEQRFKDYGYELTVNSNTEVGYLLTELNDGKQRPHIYKFSKHFNAGERVSIPNALDSDNTYCAVIVYDDYGVEQELSANPTALKSITVDGNNLYTFVPSVKEITATLDVEATTAPVIEAVPMGGEATVNVTNPDTFPGQTVITVSKDGCEDTEYIITWQTSVSLVSDMAISPDYAKYTYNNGTKDVTATAPLPVYMESLEVGSKAYADRDFLVEEVNGEILGKPYLAIPLSWQNGQPWRDGVYTANYIEDWLTFKVNRNAIVRIIKDSYKTTNNDNKLIDEFGFVHKKYTEYKPIVVNVSSNNTHPDYIDEFSKTVSAGETVTIPNIYDGQVYFVVFDFEGYTE